jgi:hypothetical protein
MVFQNCRTGLGVTGLHHAGGQAARSAPTSRPKTNNSRIAHTAKAAVCRLLECGRAAACAWPRGGAAALGWLRSRRLSLRSRTGGTTFPRDYNPQSPRILTSFKAAARGWARTDQQRWSAAERCSALEKRQLRSAPNGTKLRDRTPKKAAEEPQGRTAGPALPARPAHERVTRCCDHDGPRTHDTNTVSWLPAESYFPSSRRRSFARWRACHS